MKINDQQLERLLRGASRAPVETNEQLSAVQQTRALANWRSARSSGDWLDVRRFFRVGLAFAGVALIVVSILTLRELMQPVPPGLAMPDSVINMAIQ